MRQDKAKQRTRNKLRRRNRTDTRKVSPEVDPYAPVIRTRWSTPLPFDWTGHW